MRRVKFEDFERELDDRKAAQGFQGRSFVRPNAGLVRSESKKALLRALAECARSAGRKAPFKTGD